jgi:guanine deaminase
MKFVTMIALHRAQWLFDAPTLEHLRYLEKGCLAIEKGRILARGSFTELRRKYPKAKVVDHGEYSIITPGFVDCHVHAPQMEMMGAAGYSLLEWLENHTFPTEMKYAKAAYAKARWKEFCENLLRCGTTYAAIYSTAHTKATDLLLEACSEAGLRAHVGKALMDRHAPAELLQDADEALNELDGLINKWAQETKVRPSITVRFAPTSSPELLKGAGELHKKYPDLVIQTHLGETTDEIAWVKELFPSSANYATVYADNGLINHRSLLGHCIYVNSDEQKLLRSQRAHLVHCPSSNFFLGSGLFPYEKYRKAQLSIAMGSDVGAGWDLSMQSTARCCYEAQALQKYFCKPAELLYLITRAGAVAMGGSRTLGLLETEYKADFVVHDLSLRPVVKLRSERCETPEDLLSALLFLGGESTVSETYVDGRRCFKK